MTHSLAALLPIHAARERRAQHVYHESNQAYELALTAQMNASLALRRLQQRAQAVRSRLFDGESMLAGDAQGLSDELSEMERRIKEAEAACASAAQHAAKALAAAQDAQKVYAAKVQNNHKMTDASKKQIKKKTKLDNAKAEQESDDDFSVQWTHATTSRANP